MLPTHHQPEAKTSWPFREEPDHVTGRLLWFRPEIVTAPNPLPQPGAASVKLTCCPLLFARATAGVRRVAAAAHTATRTAPCRPLHWGLRTRPVRTRSASWLSLVASIGQPPLRLVAW